MSEDYLLSNFSDLQKIMSDVPKKLGSPDGFQIWWRGQANSSWGLIPSSGRHYNDQKHEYGAHKLFQQKAGTRSNSIPGRYENLEWLCLMQHYGHPTRILDWTESILIGLFFAIYGTEASHLDNDGALWALNPRLLNKFFVELDRVANTFHSEVQSIAGVPFGVIPPANVRAVAFAPDEFDPRMLAQQTMMTIHGGWPISALENVGDEAFIQKIVIPAAAKPQFIKQLFQLGIRRSSLFPDLQNLSGELKKLTFE